MNFLVKILIILIILSFGAIFYGLWKIAPDLPSYTELKDYNPSLTTQVFTSDGKLLDKYFIEERLFVPIDKIPDNLIHAFISAEDKNFYKHIGIDIFAIVRASLSNILNIGQNKRLIGASTITQQVVKNFLLNNEVSFKRKFKEIILAIRIEQVLTKNQILELYLNDIYLGYGSYGVAAASLNYFNKSISNLNLEEVAYLAALPKAPNNYHPIKNKENAIERRNWVIEQMYSNNYIDRRDLIFKDKNLKVIKRESSNSIKAEYYREEIRKILYNDYGKNTLYEEGLVVKTTLNTFFQDIADSSLYEGLNIYDKRYGWRGSIINLNKISIKTEDIKNVVNPFPQKWKICIVSGYEDEKLILKDIKDNELKVEFINENEWLKDEQFDLGDLLYIEEINGGKLVIRQIPEVNGAIIVIDPHSGKILALSGGYSFNLSEFNRATQAKRQPGSAFKPFIYISALLKGYSPSTLILDAPYVIDQGPGLPKWKPSNYTDKFYGLSTMRIGIEKSRNLMTIRLADKLGMNHIKNTAKLFDVDKYLDNNLSMALGAGLVSLKNLTLAYGMMVNGGKKISPKLIESIHNRRGKLIFKSDEKKCINCNQLSKKLNFNLPIIESNDTYIIDTKVAYQITSMLEGVVKRGTGKKINQLNIPLGGKTGTTNDNKDAWFIGFSPDLVVGVYVGFDQPKSLGYKETGSKVAVPIFKSYMNKALANKNKIPFRIPKGMSFVRIDSKTGKQTQNEQGVLEPFIIGTEPYNSDIIVLDSLGSVLSDTLSGTGNLLLEE
ncbi:MAG: Penicillin-binding protein 1A [Alphaproteobacteria bacterium MarineAlpha5_Bin9]|nr:MAG: Penicillin-binding protein 1A [Alphaproteobacteria bacterium MarineAlpha5_Bin9]